MNNKVAVIGSGFAGLAAACTLAAHGNEIVVFEKNATTGGRAQSFSEKGFVFDMGPSWYWMPEIFEQFFNKFGKKVSDYYQLHRLDPSYRVFFEADSPIDAPANLELLKNEFDKLEPGSGKKLDLFLSEAKVKYNAGMHDFVWKPSHSIMEFAEFRLLKEAFRLELFSNMQVHIRKYFSHPKIIKLLEFPVLFLGAKPSKTPALYSMMNYADMVLGTWYPMGGMAKIPEAMTALAKELGVTFKFNCAVEKIEVRDKMATGLIADGKKYSFDAIIGAADYHHIDSQLLEKEFRSYSNDYWNSRVLSPSSLLFYIGLNTKARGLLHHNLFFDEEFEEHAREIYDSPAWPKKPLFYVCCPSKTDPTVAPQGKENLFFLIPVAPDMKSDHVQRDHYLSMIFERIKLKTGQDLKPHIEYCRSFAHEEFVSEYNSFKGNAYGLANTLRQTAILKPKMRSNKIKNLYYAGQLTVPGPGVPPSIISGQIAAREVQKTLNQLQPISA
jgi:phytoene desaturase